MKKKLTINTLAQSNLRARKKQYTFMIIGIILAMVFSSGVLFFASCMSTSVAERQKTVFGAQEGIYIDANEELFKKAKEQKLFSDYGFAHTIGFAYTNEDEQDNGSSIAYLDDKAKEISYISFIEGGYPEKEGEIAVEKATLSRLGLDAKIGDTISLTVKVQDGTDYLSDTVEKSYKLVGIAKNKRSNLMNSDQFENDAIPSIFVCSGTQTELGGKEKLVGYISFKFTDGFYERLEALMDKTNDNMESLILCGYRNSGYGVESNSMEENIGFIIVFIIILLIASCMGIVNAFGANLNDRKKQIGMLRTVGATRRQIIIVFGREAFIISLICAPISVAVSYFLVMGATKLMGDDFVFLPNWWVLILCAVFSIACVMLAALIPLIRAARISPIQSIRNIEYTRRMKTKRIKTQKSYNVSKLLSKRNLTFNRKGQIIVSFLLVITIVCSCYGFSFMSYSKNDYYSIPYDYSLYLSSWTNYSEYVNTKKGDAGFSENDRQKILAIPYVKTVNANQNCNALLMMDTFSDYINTTLYSDGTVYSDWYDSATELTPENIDERMTASFSDSYLEVKQQYNIDRNFYPIGINAYESNLLSILENSVTDGKINIDKINSGEEIILVAQEEIAFRIEGNKNGGYSYGIDTNERIDKKTNYLKKATCDYKAGDTIDISTLTVEDLTDDGSLPNECKINNKTVTIGAIISEIPGRFYQEGSSGMYSNMRIITSLSGMKAFSPDSKYDQININLKGDCDEELDKEMQEQIENITSGYYGVGLTSNFELVQNQKSYMNSLFFSMIAIIVLFLSISASIINNSLSSRIRESKREIGTLRAVGASQRELVDSYIRQLLSMFGWSYLAGFVIFFVSYAIIFAVHKSNETNMDMKLTIWQTVIACIVLFAVCSINLWLKIRKEMKNSIIDNIREL